jgi:hypothetical protein
MGALCQALCAMGWLVLTQSQGATHKGWPALLSYSTVEMFGVSQGVWLGPNKLRAAMRQVFVLPSPGFVARQQAAVDS